ncbi:MAG TPA: dTMP kinase [Pseudobdellovibrionaceae bacterium]|nr:dTMP kinase [Pseudobdellovibrionaceae bacterium]
MAFIVFEGLDGSGKSTLMKELEAELRRLQIVYWTTREPGGTWLGDELRNLILQKSDNHPCARAELLLYEAARAQHVEKVIRPRLELGQWVLCDRYTASSLAFQAGGRGISSQQVEWLNDFATQGLKPDLTVLLDLSIEESEKRRSHREKSSATESDRIESENSDFHQRVRQSFLDQAQKESTHWLILDAALSKEKLKSLLLTELHRFFPDDRRDSTK